MKLLYRLQGHRKSGYFLLAFKYHIVVAFCDMREMKQRTLG